MGFAIAGGLAAAGALGSGYMSLQAAGNAANTEANAANQASALQYQEFLQEQQNEAPYLSAGTSALSTLQSKLPSLSAPFTMADFQADPGYQFTLQQGQQAINNSSAARGLVDSTGTMKDLAQFNQGAASTQYQNAYNNYVQNQNQTYNQLAGIAGIGQVATAGSNQAGQTMGAQVGANTTGAANAQAAGTIGTANAYGGAISNATNAGMGAWMISQIAAAKGQPYGGGSSPSSLNSGYFSMNPYGSSNLPSADQYSMPQMGSTPAPDPYSF